MTLTLAKPSVQAEERSKHLDAAARFFDQARLAAIDGRISDSASLILKGLDQERRAKATGPQVLQLIKPRT